jgi:predicted sulfurtransferase
VQFLLSKGFNNVKNITGGIAAYSHIDSSIPEY